MSDWRLAEALKTLQHEVNTTYPDRPKDSDGTIGDSRHQAEQSDHNPLPPHAGVVTAWDITTAPFTVALADKLRLMGAAGDARVKYVIYRGRITSHEHDWKWVAYSGYSKHYDHIHLSVADDPSQYDRTDRWGVFDVTAHTASKPTPITKDDHDMTDAQAKQLTEVRKIAGVTDARVDALTDQIAALAAVVKQIADDVKK